MKEGRTPMRRVSAANFKFGQIETCGFDLAKNMGEECEVAVPLRTRGALFTPDYLHTTRMIEGVAAMILYVHV